MKKYILALDQGTSSSRAIIFDHQGTPLHVCQKEFTQHFPRPGWVEHDPEEIWESEREVMLGVLAKGGIEAAELAAVGITNQRETTIVWDSQTGKPVYNAIVWQDRRTSEYCDSLKALGLTEKIRDKTGLLIQKSTVGRSSWCFARYLGMSHKAEASETVSDAYHDDSAFCQRLSVKLHLGCVAPLEAATVDPYKDRELLVSFLGGSPDIEVQAVFAVGNLRVYVPFAVVDIWSEARRILHGYGAEFIGV